MKRVSLMTISVAIAILLGITLFGALSAQSGDMVYLPLVAVPGPTLAPFTPTFVATAPPTKTATATAVSPTATPTATALPPTKTLTPTATSTAIPTATTAPTPLAPQVSVKSSRFFTESGLVRIAGEVANTGLGSAYFVKIQAKFFDADSQLLAITDGYTVLGMTSPGMVNPFRLTLTNPPAAITQYQLNLTYQTEELLAYRPIAVISQQARDNFGVEVFGELRNDAENTVRPPQTAVTFYDADGHVIDVYSGFSSDDLAKGQSTAYLVQTFSQIGYSTYSVQAQSYLVP